MVKKSGNKKENESNEGSAVGGIGTLLVGAAIVGAAWYFGKKKEDQEGRPVKIDHSKDNKEEEEEEKMGDP